MKHQYSMLAGFGFNLSTMIAIGSKLNLAMHFHCKISSLVINPTCALLGDINYVDT